MEEPLLFIQTPPFYYIEVEEVEEVEEETQSVLEESTSVYELSRTERIKDSVIARQLNYFLQPVNHHRLLAIRLLDGNEVIGKIEEMIGLQLKLTMDDQQLVINANDIKAISTTKESL